MVAMMNSNPFFHAIFPIHHDLEPSKHDDEPLLLLAELPPNLGLYEKLPTSSLCLRGLLSTEKHPPRNCSLNVRDLSFQTWISTRKPWRNQKKIPVFCLIYPWRFPGVAYLCRTVFVVGSPWPAVPGDARGPLRRGLRENFGNYPFTAERTFQHLWDFLAWKNMRKKPESILGIADFEHMGANFNLFWGC